MSVDIFDKDKFIVSNVTGTTKKRVNDGIGLLRFDNGTSLEVRPDHLFYLGDKVFIPAQGAINRLIVGSSASRGRVLSRVINFIESEETLFVYNLGTTYHNYLVTDEFGIFYAVAHNLKPLQQYNILV